jgi:hypothetical protein
MNLTQLPLELWDQICEYLSKSDIDELYLCNPRFERYWEKCVQRLVDSFHRKNQLSHYQKQDRLDSFSEKNMNESEAWFYFSIHSLDPKAANVFEVQALSFWVRQSMFLLLESTVDSHGKSNRNAREKIVLLGLQKGWVDPLTRYLSDIHYAPSMNRRALNNQARWEHPLISAAINNYWNVLFFCLPKLPQVEQFDLNMIALIALHYRRFDFLEQMDAVLKKDAIHPIMGLGHVELLGDFVFIDPFEILEKFGKEQVLSQERMYFWDL